MHTQNIITLARKYVSNGAAMESSARLCLADAIALYDDGDYDYARSRALKSLRYSIGVFNPEYQRAAKDCPNLPMFLRYQAH